MMASLMNDTAPKHSEAMFISYLVSVPHVQHPYPMPVHPMPDPYCKAVTPIGVLLLQLLTDLNNGIPPTDRELDFVLTAADKQVGDQ